MLVACNTFLEDRLVLLAERSVFPGVAIHRHKDGRTTSFSIWVYPLSSLAPIVGGFDVVFKTLYRTTRPLKRSLYYFSGLRKGAAGSIAL